MEYRQLGRSGPKVPLLSFGTATFGSSDSKFFGRWGNTDVEAARRMIDLCLEAGVNFFDTADVYSSGGSEEVLGRALAGRREQVLISTKASFSMGPGPNDKGSSRHHLIRACEASLRRLGTDYIDLYFMHGFDALTPVEETLGVLDEIAAETGKSVAQISLNWLLRRPTVSNIVIGARNEQQLRQNLDAVGWSLSPEQLSRLDAVSYKVPIYPYWHQRDFDERNPKPTQW